MKKWSKRCIACSDVEQVTGIEPACSAWEADILPLNYTCKSNCLNNISHVSELCKSDFDAFSKMHQSDT